MSQLIHRWTGIRATFVCSGAPVVKSVSMILWVGISLDPIKRNRGGRCCRNNSFNGVSSRETGRRIFSGSLASKPSSRSMMFKSVFEFILFSIASIILSDFLENENCILGEFVLSFARDRIVPLCQRFFLTKGVTDW